MFRIPVVSSRCIAILRPLHNPIHMLSSWKCLYSAFLLETQWARCVHSLTSSLHKTMGFPVRTFPFILLWQERKEEKNPFGAQLNNIIMFLTQKKNPHSNILCVFSVGRMMHSISITHPTMPRSLSMYGTTEEVYHWAGPDKRVIPGLTVWGSIFQQHYLCGKELAGLLVQLSTLMPNQGCKSSFYMCS